MLFNRLFHADNSHSVVAAVILQPDELKPKIRNIRIVFYMNMRRLAPVSSLHEETIRAILKNSRHSLLPVFQVSRL